MTNTIFFWTVGYKKSVRGIKILSDKQSFGKKNYDLSMAQ